MHLEIIPMYSLTWKIWNTRNEFAHKETYASSGYYFETAIQLQYNTIISKVGRGNFRVYQNRDGMGVFVAL